MGFVLPACEILELIYGHNTCHPQLDHSIRRALKTGHLDEAKAILKQSIDSCIDANDDSTYTRAILWLHEAIIAHATGDLEDARRYYLQARILLETTNHPGSCWHKAVADFALGLVAKARRRWSEANQYFDHGLHTLTHLNAGDVRVNWLKSAFTQRILELQNYVAQSMDATNTVPIVGKTFAGSPRLAVPIDLEEAKWNSLHLEEGKYRIKQDVESRWMVSLAAHTAGYYAVAVDGDSMVNAGIISGDYVIFRRQSVAENGEIVVVLIDYLEDSRSTIKRFYRLNGKIVLKADNPQYEPHEMVFGESDPGVRILGKVVAVAERKL